MDRKVFPSTLLKYNSHSCITVLEILQCVLEIFWTIIVCQFKAKLHFFAKVLQLCFKVVNFRWLCIIALSRNVLDQHSLANYFGTATILP